jgi:hypothetical protein
MIFDAKSTALTEIELNFWFKGVWTSRASFLFSPIRYFREFITLLSQKNLADHQLPRIWTPLRNHLAPLFLSVITVTRPIFEMLLFIRRRRRLTAYPFLSIIFLPMGSPLNFFFYFFSLALFSLETPFDRNS